MRAITCSLVVATCALFFATTTNAAQWARTYGGNYDSRVAVLQPAPDGGYVATGMTNGADAWVLKLDASFNVLWQRAFNRNQDTAGAVQPASDGGYLVLGSTYFPETPSSSFTVGWVQKLDSGGQVAWQWSAGTLERYVAVATAQPVEEGGFIVAGWATASKGAPREVLVARLDASGSIVWRRTYGGSGDDYATAVVLAPDGSYVVAGYTSSFGAGAWLLKLDATGNVVWQNWYSGCSGSVQIARDGGYVLAGSLDSSACVLKVDATGNPEWLKVYPFADRGYATSVLPVADGGYVVAAYTSNGAKHDEAWLLKLDARGNIIWQRTYGGPGYDRAFSVQATADGGYVVAGETSAVPASNSNAWLLKVDANGAIGDCTLMGTSNATALDRPVSAVTTGATAIASSPPQPSSFILETRVTDATPVQQCYDPTPASRVPAVEYYYRAFDHYFLTTLPREIAALDAGTFPGWIRTGLSFQVYGLDPGAASVCRFWSGQTFAPKSSHFYTPYPTECAYLKQQGVWQFEGDVFALGLPAGPPGQGICGTATQPLYRAYNDGMSGAPNHRYTTDPVVLDEMIRHGWVMEGEASTRVFACVPAQQ